MEHLHSTYRRLRGRTIGFLVLCMVMGISMGVAPNVSFAQTGGTPPANTTIGNQASATYTDNAGNERTVTSNTVETIVQQVAALTITQGVTKNVNPGGQVSFPHTLTNNGNGTDSFSLTTAEGDDPDQFDFDNIQIFADANGDGAPDDFNQPITETPNLAAGEAFNFVILADVPANAVNGNTETIDITGTSDFDGNQTATQTNTATVSEDAVIDVIKSQSSSSGAPNSTVTITLTFTNNGNADGTNLELTDVLQSGFTYVDGSGEWSGSGDPLTDTNGPSDDPSGITYQEDGSGTITATIDQLNAGQQGTLSFDVTVDSGTEGQTISNTASYTHDDLDGNQNTNTTQYSVDQQFNVATVAPDTVTQGPVTQGATVEFVNTFTNTGSTQDRYNITLDNSNYPSGTTFTLLRSDGSGNAVNPITDSNNDGIPDVGPIAAGDDFEVILRVSLPSGASGDNGGNGFTVDKTATSVGDPDQSATHTDLLTAITENTVDLTNNTAFDAGNPAPGQGIDNDGEDDPVITNTTDPGTTTSFTLFVNNTSGQSDNYNLAASTDNTFSNITLPQGWSVQFRDPNNSNSVITNTGTIAANASKEITAVVSIPESSPPVNEQSIFFRARSSSTGAADVKHDAVTVNTVRNITLIPNNNGQVAPGGSVVYSHTLTNEGNVDENDGSNSRIELQLTNSEANGFTSVVYIDNNNDGQIDSGDEIVTSANPNNNTADLPASVGTLNHGDEVNLLVKVTAGNGVDDGTTNTATLTARDNGTDPGVNGENLNEAEAQDITTVVAGNLVIQKSQRLDSGDPFVSTDLSADPGETVFYQIVVTNQGSAPVTDIVITDNTPSFTTQEGTASVSGDGSPSIENEPGDGMAGTIRVESSSLAAGNSFTITFAVQIDS